MKINNNKDKILYLLKSRGPQTAVSLSRLLEMTSMGARQLLQDLEKNGWVHSSEEKAARGRPKQIWSLTSKAENRFPDRHNDLMADMLGQIKFEYGEQGLELLISSREKSIYEKYAKELSGCKTILQRLQKLAEIRSEEGYMAEVEVRENEFLLIENHCPICIAASTCQQFCRSELSLFQTLISPELQRAEYLLEGDRRCVYLLKN